MINLLDTLAALSAKATDADRDAAASYYCLNGGSPNIARDIRQGLKDGGFGVPAFAAHRRNVIAEALRTGQLVPVPSVEGLAAIIREEILRQYREQDRQRCPGGVAFWEEEIQAHSLANAVIAAMKEYRNEV